MSDVNRKKKTEHYLKRHQQANLMGKLVRVTRTARADEFGWLNSWNANMTDMVGETYRVTSDEDECGYRLGDTRFKFPYFVLEVVPEDTPPVVLPMIKRIPSKLFGTVGVSSAYYGLLEQDVVEEIERAMEPIRRDAALGSLMGSLLAHKLKELTPKERYLIEHKKANLVGKRVKVTRRAEADEMGWDNDWEGNMDDMLGQEVIVSGDSGGYGYSLRGSVYNFPYFVLEVVEDEPKSLLDRVHENGF